MVNQELNLPFKSGVEYVVVVVRWECPICHTSTSAPKTAGATVGRHTNIIHGGACEGKSWQPRAITLRKLVEVDL